MSSSKAGARADGSLADNDGVDEADALAETVCETGEAEELGSGIFSRLHQTIEMMKSQGTYSLGSLPFGLLSQLLNPPLAANSLRDNQRRGNPATHTLALNPFRDLAVPRPVLRHSRGKPFDPPVFSTESRDTSRPFEAHPFRALQHSSDACGAIEHRHYALIGVGVVRGHGWDGALRGRGWGGGAMARRAASGKGAMQ
ncbi:hypothetical protein B0H14DRAFT_2611146 [Mycena olivaceomarginata]|nr:hypothetical protein B0H14DRAFT_2611146 [Mycena olivaceomarginata]